GMPFNQMMGLPVELTLRTTDEGPRLFAYPVKELISLRAQSHIVPAQRLKDVENPLNAVNGELFDITAELSCRDAAEIGFRLRGVPVTYDVGKQQLTCSGKTAPLKMIDGKIRLRLLVDRTSIDIFGNDGWLYMPMGVIVPERDRSLSIYARGDNAKIA